MTAAPAGRVAGEGALLVLLAAVTAIGGVTLNVYLPARPAAQAEFHASLAATGLTVSLPGIAFAIGLLAYGPWSDRVGRRRVLLTGLGLFTIGTAIALVSGSMTMLIVGRFIQALGGAAGVTVGRAVVNDLFPREHVSRNLAYLTMVVAIANALAPAAGGLLTELGSWRAVFAALLTVSTIVTVWTARRLPETLARGAGDRPQAGIARTIGSLATEPTFIACAVQSIVCYASFLVFASYMPFVMTSAMGGSVTSYGAWYLLIAIGYFFGNYAVTQFATRLGNARLLATGAALQAVAAGVALALACAHWWHPLAVFGPWMVIGFAQGLILPSVTASAVALRPDAAGTAAGLLGFVQQVGAAIAVQCMAGVWLASPVPVCLFIAITTLIGWLASGASSSLLAVPPAQRA